MPCPLLSVRFKKKSTFILTQQKERKCTFLCLLACLCLLDFIFFFLFIEYTKKAFIDSGIVPIVQEIILQDLPTNVKYVTGRLFINLIEGGKKKKSKQKNILLHIYIYIIVVVFLAGITGSMRSTGLSYFVVDSFNLKDYRWSEVMVKLAGLLALDDFIRTELIDCKADKQLAELVRRAQITCPRDFLGTLLATVDAAKRNLCIPISPARQKEVAKFFKSKEEQRKREEHDRMIEERQRTGKKWTRGVTAGEETGATSSMSAAVQQKIGHIAREIVMTEKSYVESLEKCVKYYYDELSSPSSTCPLPPEAIGKLFGNIKEVIETNKPLL